MAWIRTEAPGSPDPDVLSRAQQEGRILLTFDKDSGELAWLPAACGVILLRLPCLGLQVIAAVVGSRSDWAGHFSVVEPERIRLRPWPTT